MILSVTTTWFLVGMALIGFGKMGTKITLTVLMITLRWSAATSLRMIWQIDDIFNDLTLTQDESRYQKRKTD